MQDLEHIKSRVEREIEEVIGQKEWTPQHAKVLEELLSCEKCIKEIEKIAHAKKRMAGLPAPTEEEDEEMMSMFNYEQDNYNYERGRGNNYMRGRNGYAPYGRRGPMRYEYEYDYMPEPEYERGRDRNDNYHYDPEYLIWLKTKKHHSKKHEDDDDDDDDEELMKKMKKLWKKMQHEEGPHGFSNYAENGRNQSGNSYAAGTMGQQTNGNQSGNQGTNQTPTGTVGK